MNRLHTAAAVLHYAEGSIAPVAFHPEGCGTCARAVELVALVDKTYATEDDPMPVFVIKGKDALAVPAIEAYRELCEDYGLSDQAGQVHEALIEMQEWRMRHPDLMKMPDHRHVPVAGTVTNLT